MYQLEVSVRQVSRAIDAPLCERTIRAYIHRRGVNDTRFMVQVVSSNTFVLKAARRPLIETLSKALPRGEFIVGRIEDTDFLPTRRRVLA